MEKFNQAFLAGVGTVLGIKIASVVCDKVIHTISNKKKLEENDVCQK